MLVEVVLTAQDLQHHPVEGKNVVVIDALRATSTIITALANGCTGVIPVREPEEANELAAKKHGGYLLGGERNSIKIPGFDLGNSPLEYRPEVVSGKQLILCTTNGTQAIALSSKARQLIIAAFLNVAAVAAWLGREARDVVLACAGTKGKFSLEDFLAAGAIVQHLQGKLAAVDLTDPALAARAAFLQSAAQLPGILRQGKHAQGLAALGLEEDVLFCAEIDKYPLVPIYREGSIRVEEQSAASF